MWPRLHPSDYAGQAGIYLRPLDYAPTSRADVVVGHSSVLLGLINRFSQLPKPEKPSQKELL